MKHFSDQYRDDLCCEDKSESLWFVCREYRSGKQGEKSFLISGETELEDEFDSCTDTLWIDMPMLSRIFHVIKQVGNYTSEKCETVETWVKSLTGG